MRKRILIADDDVAVRESLAHVLESESYQVALACDGREAVTQLLHTDPDLVLLDLNMPGKDGWEAFDLMAKLHPTLPVIVITARPHQFEQAAGAGIDALMEKPLDLPLLLQTIRGFLAEPEADRLTRISRAGVRTSCLSGAPTHTPSVPTGSAQPFDR